MNSFSIYTPTRILFGTDQLKPFAQALAKLGRHAFVVVGGGSTERLGYLAEVTAALEQAGLRVSVFRGIEPNPEAATINRATAALRTCGADVVVPLGGGSTMDAAKAIAALATLESEHDIWPFVRGEPREGQLTGALPLAAIATTAATASEVTSYAVISNRTVKGKSVLAYEFLKPALALLDPEFTTQLPPTPTRDGAADILSHVFENYLLGGNDSPLADRHAEGVMATVIQSLPRVLAKPDDLAHRGQLLWASTLALNDYASAGRQPSQFVLHAMEHALSGWYPDLAHGRGLATLYPAYFRWLLTRNRARERFAQLGERLFGITGADAPERFIATFEEWLDNNGLRQSLGNLGIAEADYPAIAAYAVKVYGDGHQLDALGPLPPAEIVSIFKATAQQAHALRH
jgi:alcohol dehydrogenase YqhD (iron-dependent ADH family)